MDWKRLRILLKCIKQSSLCPVVLANLANQTVLGLFVMCRINYILQTGRITTESWSQSGQGTKCLRTTPGMHAYCNFSQNGHLKSRFSNSKVILNSTATTWLPCIFHSVHMAFHFYKTYSFHYSYFCYLDDLAQSLPVQKADSALFEWHSCYWPRSYTLHPVHPNFYFYKTFSFTS